MKKKSHPAVHPQKVREQAIKLMDEIHFTLKQVGQKLNVPYKTVQAWKTKHHATLPQEQFAGHHRNRKRSQTYLTAKHGTRKGKRVPKKSVGVLCEGVRTTAKYAPINRNTP